MYILILVVRIHSLSLKPQKNDFMQLEVHIFVIVNASAKLHDSIDGVYLSDFTLQRWRCMCDLNVFNVKIMKGIVYYWIN